MRRGNSWIWLCLLLTAGCSSTGKWNFTKLSEIPVEASVPPAAECRVCHEAEYGTWEKTDHGDPQAMAKITVAQLKECGACHGGLAAHAGDPESNHPPAIASLDKSGQNRICGNCHYNKDLLGWKSINPNHRHGLFMSVGFQGKKRQLSCLDCHEGHGGKREMLQSIQAHTCFKCHKEAIATMGVFQPLNYLAAGKVCTACHAPHGTSALGHAARMTVGFVGTCMPCHV